MYIAGFYRVYAIYEIDGNAIIKGVLWHCQDEEHLEHYSEGGK